MPAQQLIDKNHRKAQELIDKGYRRVSNKYRTVSRIDQKDWVDIVYSVFTHNKPGIMKAVKTYFEGKPFFDFGFMAETVECEARSAADMYRRCHSKDKIDDVDYEIFKLIPSSGWDKTGYIGK